MSRITDALKKAAQERQAREKEIASFKKPFTTQKLPLEERLKSRVYIAKATDDSGIDPRIVTYFDPTAFISEQYRMLRTNIQFNSHPKPLKTVLISSALHGEGKTITAVNLAVTMARDLEKTVLLVDCDLRAGIIHRLLGLDITQGGLSEILVNDAPLRLGLYKTRINSLTVLPRGNIPHNPSELLGSKKMKALLEELKSNFDYIILDSPPILPLTDACVLSSQVEGVILVVQSYRTVRGLVEHAQNLLNHVHAKILGFVLTQTGHSASKHYYRNIQRDELVHGQTTE